MRKTLLILIIISLFLLTACENRPATYASDKPVEIQTDKKEVELQQDLLKSVAQTGVMSQTDTWDADPDDDGLAVFVDLKDSNDNTVQFEGIQLPVHIEVWTVKMDDDFKEKKDKLAYEGEASISSWQDGNFLMAQGIRIPFEEIKTSQADNDFGWVEATVTLPDGSKYTGREEFARIKAD